MKNGLDGRRIVTSRHAPSNSTWAPSGDVTMTQSHTRSASTSGRRAVSAAAACSISGSSTHSSPSAVSLAACGATATAAGDKTLVGYRYQGESEGYIGGSGQVSTGARTCHRVDRTGGCKLARESERQGSRGGSLVKGRRVCVESQGELMHDRMRRVRRVIHAASSYAAGESPTASSYQLIVLPLLARQHDGALV